MLNTFLSQKHQKHFEEKGYITTPLLLPEEVQYILEQLKKMQPDDGFDPNRSGRKLTDYHCTFLDTNTEYKRQAKKLIKDFFFPASKKILDNYKILDGNFYIKQPGKGVFQPHQNWTMIRETETCATVTIWCPLIDTDAVNGTIQVVKGSHKLVPDIATVTAKRYFDNFIGEIEKYSKHIPLKAGESIIFDDTLLHFSGRNKSKEPRYAIQVMMIPDELEPIMYYLDESKGNNDFEIFKIDDSFFITKNAQNFAQRPSEYKSLGFVKNVNTLITEEEFMSKLHFARKARAIKATPTDKASY